MRLHRSVPFQFVAFAMAAFVSGCSLSSMPIPSGRTVAPAGHPKAAQQLLYVDDVTSNDVYIYSYPQDKRKKTIGGFNIPQGECGDAAGDVWVTNARANNILEYAHGGTTPIATLTDPFGRPITCSIDPTTGNLAVTNFFTSKSGVGGISVYKHAQGNPKNYTDSKFLYYNYVGYDNAGDAFVDGVDSASGFVLAELPKGKNRLKTITLNHSIGYGGNIQWDGTYLAIGDENANVIYQTTGASGTVVGSTTLGGASNVNQFFIAGNVVVGPDQGNGTVEFWNYPSGGSPIKTITGFSLPAGAAISQ